MRKFTENDIKAASVALRSFLGELDGRIRKSKSLVPVVERAFEAGLTLDQVLNRNNWMRASEKISGLSPEDYINLLCDREVVCKNIKDEDGWCDDMHVMHLLSKVFHDFYMTICPRGGTWNTESARLNLEKAIKLHSLQAIMSEESIISASGDEEPEEGMTCFNYIQGILKGKVILEDALTEEQLMRINREEELDIYSSEEEEDVQSANLVAETAPDDMDDSIFDSFDLPNGNVTEDYGSETFVSFMHPREMKRAALQTIIYNYRISELNELFQMIPNVTTLADFIEKLTDGSIDRSRSSLMSRTIHQYLNGDLMPTFINCVNMQGFEMTEEMALQHDPLLENWDFRDERTRKVHKLKQLIYNHGEEDADLLACIQDIERFYTQEN